MSKKWKELFMCNKRINGHRRIIVAAVAVGMIVVPALAGCSSGAPGGSSTTSGRLLATQADISAALQKKTTLNFWGWAPQTKGVLAQFAKAYPNVTVQYTDMGNPGNQYIKLQNAIKAGSGVPDAAQIEYGALPQFALGKSLVDLNEYGTSSLASTFTKATWSEVNINGALYGVPQDSGPLAFFYRKDIFDKYGLTVPKTWDEYVADAKKLHEADATKFIGSDSGDGGFVDSLIWQAGGKPFKFSGTTVTISLADAGSNKWASMYSPLLQGGLLDTKSALYTPEWVTGLCGSKYASMIAGGWGAGTLEYFCPKSPGLWRVASIPQYSATENVSAQLGGSSTSVLAASNNKVAAIGFAQWFSTNAAAMASWQSQGGFPSQQSVIQSSEWINKPSSYFGDQLINKVFRDSTDASLPGWQYLPFNNYANSVFGDSVGQAYANKIPLAAGLLEWQKTLVSYGNSQGFTVTK